MSGMKEEERSAKLLLLCDCYNTLQSFARIQGVPVSEAEELVQDTIALAYEKIDQLSSVDKMDGWLFTILKRNLCRLGKKNSKHKSFCCYESEQGIDINEIPDVDYNGLHDAMEMVMDNNELLNIIDGLADPAPQIIRLCFFDGYKLREIAEILSMNYSTIRSIHARALKKLKEQICQRMGEAL
ncbi:MAG TPA: RNA polymerase sigma factor [Anaerovoracaceae bacterium]|nr:RNA polymerase sigma factor [Anaerovoracaceae bacterium]